MGKRPIVGAVTRYRKATLKGADRKSAMIPNRRGVNDEKRVCCPSVEERAHKASERTAQGDRSSDGFRENVHLWGPNEEVNGVGC
jgi:hypothetical protein